MTSTRTRLLSVFTLALLLAVPAAFAEKHRAVRHPSPGNSFQATVRGTVVDDATGAPVRQATVRFGGRTDITTDTGAFVITNATAFGNAEVSVSRSGYVTSTQTVSTAGTHELTFRLTSKPTATVKLTDNTTRVVDVEESRFGYAVLFGGYIGVDRFCKTDGSTSVLTISQIKRVAGPATQTTIASCCSDPGQKVRLELRSGENTDAVFVDSCAGYGIDFIARDHVTGQFTYSKMIQVSEIVFP